MSEKKWQQRIFDAQSRHFISSAEIHNRWTASIYFIFQDGEEKEAIMAMANKCDAFTILHPTIVIKKDRSQFRGHKTRYLITATGINKEHPTKPWYFCYSRAWELLHYGRGRYLPRNRDLDSAMEQIMADDAGYGINASSTETN